MVFANRSIVNTTVPIPLLCEAFTLKKDMFNFLEVAHEKAKAVIAEKRKNEPETVNPIEKKHRLRKMQFWINPMLLSSGIGLTEIKYRKGLLSMRILGLTKIRFLKNISNTANLYGRVMLKMNTSELNRNTVCLRLIISEKLGRIVDCHHQKAGMIYAECQNI
jgi:hypothetical protein